LVLCCFFLSPVASAHELRPAYLDLREISANTFAVTWKVPARGEMRLGLYLDLPEQCKAEAEPLRSIEANAHLERWTVVCSQSLKGAAIGIRGLRSTLTDALAHISYLDGSTETARMTPEHPSFIVAGTQTSFEVAGTYFRLGVEHILAGIDHLLFIFALLLLISSRWMLLKTITAFTVAHSITLTGAALGYLSLPQKPVEAIIALSIAFVASEILKMRAGEKRLSQQFPWLVAFAFGLLHGFGFAGALKEIGLPQIDVPLALLTFNAGVEAGQLLFVLAAVVARKAVIAILIVPMQPLRTAAAYLIGAISTAWLFERLASFVG
jgi:hydrogenase/urease accessory protein HupE